MVEAVGSPPLALDLSVQSSRFHEAAASTLCVRGLTLAVGAGRRELLRDADLQLSRGRRYALMGRNGCGKSLLLRALASGELFEPDVQLRLRVQLVAQTFAPPPNAAWSVRDELAVPPFGHDLSGALCPEQRAQRQSALRSGRRGKEARAAAVQLAAAGEENEWEEEEEDGAGLGEGGDPQADAEPGMGEILGSFRALGIPAELLSAPFGDLSGGWRMRVVLAKALLYHPHVLLLDEPTNHLDISGINHLAALLCGPHFADTTVVFVSHDLHFVNACTQGVIQVQEGKLHCSRGNWDTAVRERGDRAKFSAHLAAEQARERDRLLSSIDASLRSAGRDDKARKQLASRRDKALERGDGLLRNSRGHRFKRNADENAGHHLTLLAAVEEVQEERPVCFAFEEPSCGRGGRAGALLAVNGLRFAYDSGGGGGGGGSGSGFTLELADLRLGWGERVVLLGPNGHGKSTLLRLLVGELEASSSSSSGGGGSVRSVQPQPLAAGYFEQHAVARLSTVRAGAKAYLQADASWQCAEGAGGDRGDAAHRALGAFGLGAHTGTPVAQLSGGQRVALELVLLALRRPGVLLLDEPSAHLDLQARAGLARALAGFAGAVLLISHDVGFLELVAPTRALLCSGGRFTALGAEEWRQAALQL